MNNKNFKILIILFIPFIFSCNKKEKINSENIKGNVLNTVSGKPVKNYTVYLSEYYYPKKKNTGKKLPSNFITQTDHNGNFSFENVAINQSNEYSYELIVKNSSQSNFPSQPNISSANIDKSNISNMFYSLRTLPLANTLTVKLNPSSPITFPDSINVEFKYEFYNIVNPPNDLFFKRVVNSKSLRIGPTSFPGGLPAGLWYIEILKIKNGITTTTTDSIFMNFNESNTYTLSF